MLFSICFLDLVLTVLTEIRTKLLLLMIQYSYAYQCRVLGRVCAQLNDEDSGKVEACCEHVKAEFLLQIESGVYWTSRLLMLTAD